GEEPADVHRGLVVAASVGAFDVARPPFDEHAARRENSGAAAIRAIRRTDVGRRFTGAPTGHAGRASKIVIHEPPLAPKGKSVKALSFRLGEGRLLRGSWLDSWVFSARPRSRSLAEAARFCSPTRRRRTTRKWSTSTARRRRGSRLPTA